MSDSPPRDAAEAGMEGITAGGDALIGLATLGKTAAALVLIVVIILVATALLRRWGLPHQRQGHLLRVVASTAVGTKERVVVVEVENTWLVLGVGGGQVNKLHELDAPPPAEAPRAAGAGFAEGDSFGARFAKALKHNAGLAKANGQGAGHDAGPRGRGRP
ncbi:MAG TPA: flagellar biosynthetic protein FliO [Halomonas sp.]|nr:flagellar biosynthetic protein FliO [Halomonas sp.]